MTTSFRSILFADRKVDLAAAEPAFFHDLNLDQVIDALVAGRDEYDLRPFFRTPLRDPDLVAYRHEVFRDLEPEGARGSVAAFSESMERVRRLLHLAETQFQALERQRWLVDAAALYCDAVVRLRDELVAAGPASRGLRALAGYLDGYTDSDAFRSLVAEAGSVLDGLAGVRYTVRIRGARVTVGRYEGEPDLGAAIEQAFARFRRGAVDEHLVNVPDSGSMDHVEGRIAELVGHLFPREFGALAAFCERHGSFLDPRLVQLDREVQVYLAVLELRERVEASGQPFAYPVLGAAGELAVDGGFDLALAVKLGPEAGSIVRNDVELRAPERIIAVTGPNQGGKTTFARMVGQVVYLAALGVLVPARAARLPLPDRVFVHFEREEDISTLRGKLEDELVRLREILDQATADSVVILNEVFASTTLADAVRLGGDVLRRIRELGCVAVLVTFVDELAVDGGGTVSMVAGVRPEDPSQRTYSIERRPADGRAYAWAIADKYGLSYERLRERLR